MINSPETFGPTLSTEGKVICGATALSASSTACTVSGVIDSSSPWASIRTIATFLSSGKFGSNTSEIEISPRFSGAMASR